MGFALISRIHPKKLIMGLEECHAEKKEIFRRVQAGIGADGDSAGGDQESRRPGTGINANMLGRWCRDYAENGAAAFPGQGKPRDEEMAPLKRELVRVKKERDFLQEAAACRAPLDVPPGRIGVVVDP